MDRVASMAAFVKVVETGGFSAAARRLNLSPTMVSNHVQALEERLGARLLNRTTRKVSLTEIGRAYYERCLQILAEIDEADEAAGALQVLPRGLLRINTSPALARLVARVGTEFTRRYGEASISLYMTDRMVDMVEEGYDLAVRIVPTEESRLIVRHLATFDYVLCGAPAYFERHGKPKRPADLAKHNCLRYSHPLFGNDWRFTGPEGVEKVTVSGNLETNSVEALRVATLGGQGLLLAPTFMITAELKSGSLAPALEGYRPPQYPIAAIYPHRRHLSAKVRSFIDLLAKRFAEPGYWVS
jgi:DNA-binding transcriptional LysR family regulator